MMSQTAVFLETCASSPPAPPAPLAPPPLSAPPPTSFRQRSLRADASNDSTSVHNTRH